MSPVGLAVCHEKGRCSILSNRSFLVVSVSFSDAAVLSTPDKYLNIPINKTISVGDYNNDISMFKTAKIGIAVANACPDAKAAADIITVSNDENAIAKVIYDLEIENIKI